MQFTEIIGYLGSLLVAVSLTMSNIFRLRLINLVGAAVFTAYGVFIHSVPVILLNAWIVLVDVYYLSKLILSKDSFELIFLKKKDAAWPNQFLDYYAEDVQRFFPNFELAQVEEPVIVMVRRNMVPVGILVYHILDDGNIYIDLDYVAPEYRDFKNARFLYSSSLEHCIDESCQWFITETDIPAHAKYLKKIGFRQSSDDPNRYYKPL